MRRTCFAILVLSLAAGASSAQDAPINSTCPVMKGKPVKPGITATYKGKTVGFC